MQGWIKLHRKIMYSPVWNEPGILKLWLYCILKASHKEREILLGQQVINLQPGQFITGRNSLHNDFNKGVKPANRVSATTLWRWMKMFEKCSNIVLKTNNKYSLVTIVNWEKYQGSEQEMNSKRTANEQQMNTNKNVKNVKNVNKKEYAPFVKMTEEEHQKLITDYGETIISEMIEDLNNWKGGKGKRTKSDYLTIRAWIRREQKQGGKSSGQAREQPEDMAGKYRAFVKD